MNFCPNFSDHVKKWHDKKAKVNLKIMRSQTEQKIITIHILPYISRSKANQIMTFSRLAEFNMRYIFLGKSYTKCGGEASPDPFLENQNWIYLGINHLNSSFWGFYCISSRGLPKYIKTKVLLTTCLSSIKLWQNEVWN